MRSETFGTSDTGKSERSHSNEKWIYSEGGIVETAGIPLIGCSNGRAYQNRGRLSCLDLISQYEVYTKCEH